MIRRDLFRIGASALAWMLGKKLVNADAPSTDKRYYFGIGEKPNVLWSRDDPGEAVGCIAPIGEFVVEFDSCGRIVTLRQGENVMFDLRSVESDGEDILLRLTKCKEHDQLIEAIQNPIVDGGPVPVRMDALPDGRGYVFNLDPDQN